VLKLYLNGSLVFQANTGNPAIPSAASAIGLKGGTFISNVVNPELGGGSFSGVIDEFEAYNRALSASEIQAIFDADSAGKCKLQCTPPPSGLVSWWPGDGNASDIQDANDGTSENGATFATGKVGQAFSFDGVDDSVVVQDAASLDITTGVTLDAWINPSSLACPVQFCAVVAKSDAPPRNYGLWVQSDGALHLSYRNVSGVNVFLNSPPGTITVGNFQHVAGVIDTVGGTMTLFMNGQEVATRSTSGAMVANDAPLTIGFSDPGFNFNFNGLIDEVEIYNRALSASEIQAIFDADSAGKCKPVTDFDLGHFECYKAWTAKGTPRFEPLEVTLDGQSGSKTVTVLKPVSICIPVDKNGEGITNPDAYLVCYRFKIKDAEEEAEPIKSDVLIQNQFGEQTLTVFRPHFLRHRFLRSYFLRHQTLCVPSTKEELGVVGDLDD
jgi:hypothetical protein